MGLNQNIIQLADVDPIKLKMKYIYRYTYVTLHILHTYKLIEACPEPDWPFAIVPDQWVVTGINEIERILSIRCNRIY